VTIKRKRLMSEQEERTSESHPIQVDFLPQEALELPGQLGLTLAPGKKADASDGRWARDLETDLRRLREEYDTGVLVSLLERDEYSDLGVDELFQKAEEMGIEVLHLPIPNYGVPLASEEGNYRPMIEDVAERLEKGQTVVVHCRGGLGRSGMVAASVLVALGRPAEEAIRIVREAREGSVETPDQEDRVRFFEMELQSGGGSREED
jgi:protein-tyrosine phosphatase